MKGKWCKKEGNSVLGREKHITVLDMIHLHIGFCLPQNLIPFLFKPPLPSFSISLQLSHWRMSLLFSSYCIHKLVLINVCK